MNIWTTDEEAEHLASRFQGVNRAKFARTYDVPGGQVMVYQHITGRRPMSMEAAQAYARGFGCSLEEISPRLAKEASKAVAMLGGTDQTDVSERYTADEADLVLMYRGLPDEQKRLVLVQIKALSDLSSEKVNPVTAEKSGTIGHQRSDVGSGRHKTVNLKGISSLEEAVREAESIFGGAGASKEQEAKRRKGGKS